MTDHPCHHPTLTPELRCRICGGAIPPARIEVAPLTVTCGRECGRENRRRLEAAASRRYRARLRAGRGGTA